MTSKVTTAETFYLTYIGTSEKADVMLAVQAYGTNFPVPGGCNLEFQVEISPFLQTIYTDVYTEVDFAPAAPPHQVIADFNLSKTDECNLKPSHVTYEVHYQYFPQMDFSKETYFKMISSMMTVGRIRNHSSIAKEKLFSVKTRRIFASYPRIGRVFSVTAQYSDYSVSYVPSVTYGCNPKDNMSCEILMSTPQKVLCISVMLLGLFVCFFGHYFFRIEFFLFGFFISGLTTYILVWIILGPTMALSVSIGIGFFAAGSILLAWGICQVVLVSFLFATLGLGFLFASIIVNPLLDVVDVLVFDVNYWGVFIGITLACPILMLSLSHKGNAISCSIIGAYAAVAAADFFVNSNLRFIVLNTIRRAISEKFRLALIALPFQQKDWLLVMGWCLLSAAGGGIQYLLIDCTRHVSRSRNFSSGPSWRRYRRVPNERTPLIKRINGKQFLLKI
ncbi:hypothetical protein RUM44_007991 [Polyplax serrata]|uniref:TM7S3/TM198-like domain-containing protein n=1 Tax=Polyplax serrata TaxID=468196 RepID=A0ABR1B8W0_POLSC